MTDFTGMLKATNLYVIRCKSIEYYTLLNVLIYQDL